MRSGLSLFRVGLVVVGREGEGLGWIGVGCLVWVGDGVVGRVLWRGGDVRIE